jgi:hypothetical protein
VDVDVDVDVDVVVLVLLGVDVVVWVLAGVLAFGAGVEIILVLGWVLPLSGLHPIIL